MEKDLGELARRLITAISTRRSCGCGGWSSARPAGSPSRAAPAWERGFERGLATWRASWPSSPSEGRCIWRTRCSPPKSSRGWSCRGADEPGDALRGGNRARASRGRPLHRRRRPRLPRRLRPALTRQTGTRPHNSKETWGRSCPRTWLLSTPFAGSACDTRTIVGRSRWVLDCRWRWRRSWVASVLPATCHGSSSRWPFGVLVVRISARVAGWPGSALA